MKETPLKAEEKLTGHLYGAGFSLFDDQEFKSVIQPIIERFKKNNIPLETFQNKVCLDAGCGGGRGTIFMLQNGAKEVFSVDLDQQLIDYTKAKTKELGFENAHVSFNSILELPFDDEKFDVVFCNGVIHRTDNPDSALLELTRVLKPGGHLFLYTLGAGGINYHLMDWIRGVLGFSEIEKSIKYLHLLESNPLKLAAYLDDWFMPMFRRYTAKDMTARLQSLGYENREVLKYGTVYDTSHRKNAGDRIFMGEGDLRFFSRKTGPIQSDLVPLPDVNHQGSAYVYPKEFLQLSKKHEEITDLLKSKFKDGLLTKLTVVRSLQDKVRDLLKKEGTFDMAAYSNHLDKTISLLGGI